MRTNQSLKGEEEEEEEEADVSWLTLICFLSQLL